VEGKGGLVETNFVIKGSSVHVLFIANMVLSQLILKLILKRSRWWQHEL